jgi:hypothetical protein
MAPLRVERTFQMASPVTAITQSNLAIGDTAQTQQAAKPAASQKALTQATTTNLPNDTVQISPAAQTAVQEALETRTQTLEEVAKGDPQAETAGTRAVDTSAAKSKPQDSVNRIRTMKSSLRNAGSSPSPGGQFLPRNHAN